MIQLHTIEQLPESLPLVVRQALTLASTVEQGVHATIRWGKLTGFLLRLTLKYGEDRVTAGFTELDIGTTPAERLGDTIERLLRERVPAPTPGAYVGAAVLSEGTRGVAPPPELSGDELETFFLDNVASGQVRHFRAVIAVLVSGWRFELLRYRDNNPPTIELYAPGEDWPDAHEGVAAVTALNDAFALG